jgi:hypothetical protein|tara:strand:+ start:201 stop:431 length:231 start_codon:yes stop_codon:yes gene_type:complete
LDKEFLNRQQKIELSKIAVEVAEEARSVVLDYEETPSNLESGSVIEVHIDSPLLKDEKEKLSDIAFQVKRKKEIKK